MSAEAKQRVVEEFDELTAKIRKLSEFQVTGAHASLPSVQKSLLKAQLPAMRAYAQILEMRLAMWGGA